MFSLVLSRGFVAQGGGFADDLVKLANTLSKDFGYEGHKHKVSYGQIRATLKSIGCAPFTAKSVRRYQRWMAFKARGGNWLLSSIFSTMLTLIALLEMPTRYQTGWVLVPLITWGLVSALAIIFAGMYISDTTAHWERCLVSGYNGILPDEAARKMAKIKLSFPDVAFTVESLRVERVEKDPFLIALIDKYKFYVSVWDEPEYVPQI